jgi:phi13 family phage major tail protein
MPSSSLQEILEWRGVEGLVAAEVLTDDDVSGYTTGDVFAIAGVAEISRSTDSSNEAHYYDNIPAVIVSSTSADEVTITTSAIPFDVFAEITGQHYDSDTGALIEGPRDVKYFALGYKTQKTNGDEVYVWRYKGTFNIPTQTNSTQNDSTDANGQEITYTGIATTHKFVKTGKGAKALNVDVAKNLANVSSFFSTVVTPDTLVAKTSYKLTITQAANTTVTVKRGGVALATNADIYAGDVLTITVTGGTVEVNSTAFISGDMHVVTGATTVVSTASA